MRITDNLVIAIYMMIEGNQDGLDADVMDDLRDRIQTLSMSQKGFLERLLENYQITIDPGMVNN